MDLVTWLSWLIVGVLTGWLVSVVWGSNLRLGLLYDTITGIVGAVVGGVLYYLLIIPGTTTFNVWSLLVAFVGAVILLGLLRLITYNRPTVAQ